MNLIPEFTISWMNGFWFSLVFIITNIVMIKIFPEHYKKRVLTMPKFNDMLTQAIGTFNFILFQGLIIISIFIPVKYKSVLFIHGIALFFIGYVFYVISLINYATTNPDRPVVKGMYKYSRNPQQIMTIVMWLGVGLAMSNYLILIICLIQIITVYPTFIAQEEYCIKKYGDAYREYMNKTPMYLGIPKSKKIKKELRI